MDSKLTPRQEALAKNEMFYFTGKPCSRGHTSKRYVKTRTCYECDVLHQQSRPVRVRRTMILGRYKVNGQRLNQEEYEHQLERQEYKCAICNGELILPSVDHNHETGEARGILCHTHNVLLGFAQEDIAILERAITYLKADGIWGS